MKENLQAALAGYNHHQPNKLSVQECFAMTQRTFRLFLPGDGDRNGTKSLGLTYNLA